LRDYVWRTNPGLMTHEWAHILQVAQYPLLHLRAARQLRTVVHRIIGARTGEPVTLPVRWSIENN
jgi:hypothetical protein